MLSEGAVKTMLKATRLMLKAKLSEKCRCELESIEKSCMILLEETK